MAMTRIIALISTIFMVTGCVGLQAVIDTRKETCDENCYLQSVYGGYALYKGSHEPQEYDLITKEHVLERWGQPKKKLISGDIEEWEYSQARWVGIVPHIIIPIPLMLPIGKDMAIITFKNNSFFKAYEEKTVAHSYICSIFPMLADPGGFCWSRDDVSQVTLKH